MEMKHKEVLNSIAEKKDLPEDLSRTLDGITKEFLEKFKLSIPEEVS